MSDQRTSKPSLSAELRRIADAIYTQNALRSQQLSEIAHQVARLERSVDDLEYELKEMRRLGT